jgi:hypothetical protein
MARVMADLAEVLTLHHFVKKFQGAARIAQHYHRIERQVERPHSRVL